MAIAQPTTTRVPWNHGRIIGPKPPLKPKHIWAIRTRLQHDGRVRDLAMFNVAIDSKLRGCDVVRLRVADIRLGESVRLRTTVVEQKTGRPVPFELTEPTREALAAWLKKRCLRSGDWLFPSRSHAGDHVTTRSTAALSMIGSPWRAWTLRATGHTACAGPRWRSSTSGLAIYGPASSYSVTQSWRAPSATSASRSMTPWFCPSRLTCEASCGGPAPPRSTEKGGQRSSPSMPKADA